MKAARVPHIAMALCAVIAAAVLFITYGTVLPSTPFSPVSIDGPSAVDSNGQMTVVVDSGSQRTLILNAEGNLTGVISCTTVDSPIDAITDVCASGDMVYLSGVRFAPDSSIIAHERVIDYDKGGNLKGIAYGIAGSRIGLRRLMAGGALVMLLCAVLTALAVSSGQFPLYCAAKLAMSVPFGLLYSLGYSLPRLARDDKTRADAAGGVKRTDTSAAALGTVLGGLLCKSSDGWKALWLKAAGDVGVPVGRATGAMFATRSFALIAQPFILGGLLGVSDSIPVIVIGLICLVCAGLFFALTRKVH